jgi:hypothetical protein
MFDDSTLYLQEQSYNHKSTDDDYSSTYTVQPRVLVRFPKFYQLSENLLYWQRIERCSGPRSFFTNV